MNEVEIFIESLEVARQVKASLNAHQVVTFYYDAMFMHKRFLIKQ